MSARSSLLRARHTVVILITLIAYLIFTYYIGPLLERFEIIGHKVAEEISHIIITVGAVVLGALVDRNLLFGELNKIFTDRNCSPLKFGVLDELFVNLTHPLCRAEQRRGAF